MLHQTMRHIIVLGLLVCAVVGLRATGELMFQPEGGPQLLLTAERARLLIGPP